jgi:hypothetical protein
LALQEFIELHACPVTCDQVGVAQLELGLGGAQLLALLHQGVAVFDKSSRNPAEELRASLSSESIQNFCESSAEFVCRGL